MFCEKSIPATLLSLQFRTLPLNIPKFVRTATLRNICELLLVLAWNYIIVACLDSAIPIIWDLFVLETQCLGKQEVGGDLSVCVLNLLL